MSLKERIGEDIKAAMKAKDQAALRALRAVKSAILLAETAEGRNPDAPLTEAEELQLLQKQVKQRRDSAEQFTANGRADLAQAELEEAEVIARYLPQALTEDELETALRAIIAQVGAVGVQDLGKVMKEASTQLAGRADNKAVSELTRKLLSA
jgi:uncharacterized protein YqeY